MEFPENENKPKIAINDFNFLVGKWKVLNRRLKERLKGCEEWVEFEAEMETKEILNGLGFMDEMKSSFFGDGFAGLSVRIVNPASGEWRIYWADTENPERGLTEQVVGKFENGIGVFQGIEVFEGKEMTLRFIWKKESKESAHWEQAYFDEITGEWETNWTMLFTRAE